MKKLIANFILISFLFPHGGRNDHKIEFPDLPGLRTLVCDLHMHTVFSDGSVWPNIRVMEANKDGLDVIATTEHLENQSWISDIPHPNRNRSYELAKGFADELGLLVLNGSGITIDMPPGHANAIFIKDANKLIADDPIESFLEAKKQDAFIFWNHPHWASQSPDASIPLDQLHIEMINNELIQGIEVVNDTTYSNEAFQLALEYDLTILGTSNIHDIVDWQYRIPSRGHRPVTLVFAREKKEKALKKALLNGQTVVWYDKKLIGKSDHLLPLINGSLKIKSAHYLSATTIAHVVISNNSDAPYTMRNQSEYDFYNGTNLITIPPHESAIVDVRTLTKKRKFELQFEVLNALVKPDTHPLFRIVVRPKQ